MIVVIRVRLFKLLDTGHATQVYNPVHFLAFWNAYFKLASSFLA